jgi:hypothetical protein
MQARVEYDLEYLRNWSLGLDLQIIAIRAPRVRLEAGTARFFDRAGHRQVDFSASEFAAREYKQDSANLSVVYRPSAILSLSVGGSAADTKYQAPEAGQTENDSSKRRDLFVAANWVPTGASTVDARLAYTTTEYRLARVADFDGVTGSLGWAWRPTGLLSVNTSLVRDTGQESGFRLTPGSTTTEATDFSQVTDRVTIGTSYELTGKVRFILLTGAAGYIGSHTWVLLEQAGFQVVGVDDHRNSSPRVLDRLARLLGHAPVFERADVCDSAAMADVLGRHQVDAVVHFAAFKAVGESTQPLAYYRNNIGGLVTTCEAMRAAGLPAHSCSAAAPRCTATRSACPSPKTRRCRPPTPTARPS